jgi:hypothetical protein
VEEYGDLDVGSMHVSNFLGFQISSNLNLPETELPFISVSNNVSEMSINSFQRTAVSYFY